MKAPPALAHDLIGRRRHGSVGGWLLLVAGLTVTSVVALDWQDAQDETGRWTEKAERWQRLAERAGGRSKQTPAETAAMGPQLDAAAKASVHLGLPWGDLYRSLEGAADDSVSLLAVLTSADKGEVRLNGEAKDFSALRAYLKRLNESGGLADVRLLTQEIKQNDAQRPVVFAIVATWRRPS